MNDVIQPATKTHRDENFPVASALIAREHRPIVLAFYNFVRAADDIADSPKLTPDEKIAGLDRFEASLLGKDDAIEVAKPLRAALAERKLLPRHALDLLHAFRMDATKKRYANFDELMHYCAYSAAPVGRFVLDVHGESETTWPANDALCSALQIINHIQDCGADYRDLDRVYVPQDGMARHGTDVTALSAPKASANLLACLRELAIRTETLVAEGRKLSPQVKNLRLALETAVIGRLAQTLITLLKTRDPLSQKVHLSKPEVLALTLVGIGGGFIGRAKGAPAASATQARRA
ncbi:MAG: squalene synthase HpnC [Pseudomonadota bacterium]